MLDTLLDPAHDLLEPLETLVTRVLLVFHDLATTVGLDPAGGAAWSLSVVGLVVVVRAALLPLFLRQHRATRALQLLHPELQALRARYAGRGAPEDRRALQRATAQLYRTAGVNPAASCLPALLQAPVFLALTLTLQAIAAHRPVGFISGALLDQVVAATVAGAPLASTLTGAWGVSAAPVVVAACLVAATAALQVLTQRLATATAPPAPGLAAVTYLVPGVFAVTAVHFPVGVLLYWFASGAWSAAQQFLVGRLVRA